MSTKAIELPIRPRSSNSKKRPYQSSASSRSPTSSATWLIPTSRAIPTDRSASHRRRKLQDRRRLVTADQPAGRHVATELDHAPTGVEEDQIEMEEHSKRMDATAA